MSFDSESLNIEASGALDAYLRRKGHVSVTEGLTIVPLAGGVSNRTVLVRREFGPAFVVKQALPKLRVAADWYSDVRRIEREADGLRHLPSLAPLGTIT